MKTITEFVRPWVGEFYCARCGTLNHKEIIVTSNEQYVPCISCGQVATIYVVEEPDDDPHHGLP